MRAFVTGIVTFGLASALAAPAFATGKQIIYETPKGGNYIPFTGYHFDGLRFQTLLKQAKINYAGKINMVEYYNASGDTGTFNNYKLYLCHTDKKSLFRTFADNYKGTPVKVADLRSFTVPAAVGWFSLGMATTFDYNNSDNLLLEIQWQGDNGVRVPVTRGTGLATNLRIYAFNNPLAPIGNGDGCPYYTRLSFGAYTAASPTSLGRVKGLFR
jgi:hypothetical protein